MASSSKTINMPLIIWITIGGTVALVAIVMFAMAWYEYESRVVLREQVLDTPTHTESYMKTRSEQEAALGDIDAAMLQVVAEQGAEAAE